MTMAMVEVRDLSFSYPALMPGQDEVRALESLSLQVERGAFCVVTGPTGCGKSTLLRLMKPEIAPRGTVGGSLFLGGVPLVREGMRESLDPARSARLAGFVAQDPEAQVVCDTVRAELAFGLENLGTRPPVMRRRIAEVAGFLGMDSWMDRATAELSGGQKQLLNVAAVLALRPDVLLLDEPAAQLDPYARRRFLDALAAINRDLGCTVLMTTHSPELAGPYATQQVELGALPPVAPYGDAIRIAPPVPAETGGAIDGRACESAFPARDNRPNREAPSRVAQVREADFRYSRRAPWVLRDATAVLHRGSVHAFLGGNGCGKTTLLKLFAGLLKPQRGKAETVAGLRRAYLPQDPKAVFSCDSVGEELHEWHVRFGYGEADEAAAARRFGLEGLGDRHPYDLSGGQQQQLALAKLMLTGPDVLLLDEPTKGLDARSAGKLAGIIRQMADDGCAVALATHDTALVRVLADSVSLVFDGSLACTLPASEYFADTLVHGPHNESRLFGALAQGASGDGRPAEPALPSCGAASAESALQGSSSGSSPDGGHAPDRGPRSMGTLS